MSIAAASPMTDADRPSLADTSRRLLDAARRLMPDIEVAFRRAAFLLGQAMLER